MLLIRWMILSFVVLAVLLGSHDNAVASPGTIRVFLGQKVLDKEQWGEVQRQAEMIIDATEGSYSLYLAASRGSKEDAVHLDTLYEEIEGTSLELGLGMNKTWRSGRWHPYVAGGLLVSRVEITTTSEGRERSDVGAGPGLWLSGGASFQFAGQFEVGLQGRASLSKGDSEGFAPDSGSGVHLGLTLGFRWE